MTFGDLTAKREYSRPSSQASRCFDLLVVPKSGNFYLTDCFCDVFGEELAILNKFFQSNGAIPGKNENLPKYTE